MMKYNGYSWKDLPDNIKKLVQDKHDMYIKNGFTDDDLLFSFDFDKPDLVVDTND